MIQLNKISKMYGNGHCALKDINLNIEKGSFIFLVGESGAGKSTLIKLLHREQLPTEGKINVLGVDLNKIKERKIPYFRRKIGIVFQDFRLNKNKTVYENVEFVLKAHEIRSRDIKNRVKNTLKVLNLLDKKDQYPSQLSGGEKQRVAIARAIIGQPEILIADEPTGNLDSKNAQNIMDILCELNEMDITVILATHDVNILQRAKGRFLYLKDGELIKDEEGTYNSSIIAGC